MTPGVNCRCLGLDPLWQLLERCTSKRFDDDLDHPLAEMTRRLKLEKANGAPTYSTGLPQAEIAFHPEGCATIGVLPRFIFDRAHRSHAIFASSRDFFFMMCLTMR